MMSQRKIPTLRGELLIDESMARHTSWRVGGSADRYYKPADIDDLALFLSTLSVDEPIIWVGLGSNLLVRDGGIRGTVIVTSGLLNEMDKIDDYSIRAEAGVSCAKVARYSVKQSLTGAQFLAGIPGTVGGALAMNAGAFGGETWQIVSRVEVLDRTGTRHIRTPSDYEIAYRSVASSREEWFIAATLTMQQSDSTDGMKDIKALLAKRNASQPTQQSNAGSVFRNPDGDYSARLIEACGLKGHFIGDACVSEKHANFIINNGKAKANDIEELIQYVQNQVQKECGVLLEREVKIIGEPMQGESMKGESKS